MKTFEKITRTIIDWHEVSKSRRQLSQLDDKHLSDIGLTKWDRDEEIKRPFWDCNKAA